MAYVLKEFATNFGISDAHYLGAYEPHPPGGIPNVGIRFWLSQSFIAQETYLYGKVQIRQRRVGPSYSDGTIDLYRADASHHATGSILATAVLAEPGTSYEWTDCVWVTPYEVQSALEYCFVLTHSSVRNGSTPHYVNLRVGTNTLAGAHGASTNIQAGPPNPYPTLPDTPLPPLGWIFTTSNEYMFRNYSTDDSPDPVPPMPPPRPDPPPDPDNPNPPVAPDDPGNPIVAGGGRWQRQLIVAGHNLVYFEELV